MSSVRGTAGRTGAEGDHVPGRVRVVGLSRDLSGPRGMTHLQRSAGNGAVSRLVAAHSVVQRQDVDSAGTLDERYQSALRSADSTGDYRTAAELLNGFSRDDIASRLAALTDEQVSYLHLGATGNPNVGPGSQVAQLTAPGEPRASTVGPTSSTGTTSAGPAQGSVPAATGLTPEQIAAMTPTERMIEAFARARIDTALRERLLQVFTPETFVVAVVSFLIAFGASQVTPVGWAADVAILLTVVFTGVALLRAIDHLMGFAAARNATTEADLDAAGMEFSHAVAGLSVDALILLLTRRIAPAAGGGGPPPALSGFVFAGRNGELVMIAVDTVPVAVAGEVGIASGGLMSMSGRGGRRGGGHDDDHDEYEDMPRRTRISDGNKSELQESGWLRGRLPDVERRREFMEWLQRGHEIGEPHQHLRPGSREAEAALRDFLLENP
ncbi:hypothetical protein [Cellulomonas sp. NS3]|uniref:hypothetical protein n=1 Tax=Cellulomonas sp. NS3 TaxID=2973977 RepID=UPI002163F827|nr:hypothetical protein [Cellulomonas sp. NS3]